MFSKSYPFDENSADLYFLDLHAYREISNEVAALFQVVAPVPAIVGH